jgi:hypothetical protein
VIETPDEDSLAGFELEVGTLDGRLTNRISKRFGPLTPAESFRGALPVAAGPFGDLVVYAFWDGSESELRAVSVLTGEDRLLLRRNEIVHAVAMSARDRVVYFVGVDPKTRQDLGIFRLSVTQPDQVGLFWSDAAQKPPGDADQIWKRLWVTPDGAQLVAIDCPRACRAESFLVGPAASQGSFELEAGDVVGVTNDAIVTVFECSPPCPATAHQLHGGDSRKIGVFCESGILVLVDGRAALVTDWPIQTRCDADPYIVGRSSLEDDNKSAVLKSDTRERLIVAQNVRQGFAPPEGWFLIGPRGGLATPRDGPLVAPWLVRAEDGIVVALPPLGPPRVLD